MSFAGPLLIWAAAAAVAAQVPGANPGLLEGLASGDRGERLAAIEDLFEAGRRREEPRRALRALLDDPDPQVRQSAARALCALGDGLGFEIVTRWLLGASTPDRRAGLAALRGAASLPADVRRAVERVLGDSELDTRLAALAVLDEQGPAPSWRRIGLLLDDNAPPARLMAVRSLGGARVAFAAPLLRARLEDPDRQVQRAAVLALGRSGHAQAGEWLLRFLPPPGARAVDPLAGDAIAALAQLGHADALPLLAEIARRPPPDALARAAQDAVGRIGGADAREILLGLLDRTPVSRETRQGLVAAGAEVIRPLLERLEGENPEAIRGVVIDILAEIGDPRALRPLATVAEATGSAASSRIAAVAALGRLVACGARGPRRTPDGFAVGKPRCPPGPMASTAVLDVLTRLTRDPVPALRAQAYAALEDLGDARAAGVVAPGLADRDPRVRENALDLYRTLGDPSAARAVAARLSDPVLEVRQQALRSIVSVGVRTPGVAPALLAARPHLRGLEVELGVGLWLGATRADLPALTAALRKPDPPGGKLPVVLGIAAAALSTGPGPRGTRYQAPAFQPRAAGLPDPTVRWLLATISEGGLEAEVAAEALLGLDGASRASAGHHPPVRRAFFTAEPATRARLAGVLATFATGAADLAGIVGSELEDAEVRAAAAAALRGTTDSGARAALERATREPHPAVAANARAALAEPSAAAAPMGVLRIRLAGRDGRALPRRWLMARTSTGAVLWIRTGGLGQAVLPGMPGPISVGLVSRQLELEDAGDGLW